MTVLRGAGRAEGTVRRQQAVLDRFAAFLAGRGPDTASDRVCIDFIANQTGVRSGSLREPISDRAVQAVRRPVVLMAEVLAGRAVEVDRAVVPAALRSCLAGFLEFLATAGRTPRSLAGRLPPHVLAGALNGSQARAVPGSVACRAVPWRSGRW